MKYPIFINLDQESGYIGLKKSKKNIKLEYVIKNHIEIRDFHEETINFYLTDEKRIKAIWMNYKTKEQCVLYNGYIKSHSLEYIRKFLLEKLKQI